MNVFVILNVNGTVWGHEAFTSADVAEQELRHFFKRDFRRDQFRITELELHDAITGDFAGIGMLSTKAALAIAAPDQVGPSDSIGGPLGEHMSRKGGRP
jgi:hypothetical protein